MTPDELLQPRYKVIADYPGNQVKVGEILAIYQEWKEFTIRLWCESNDKYPHLFRKLEWWEDRKVEDMPEYVKRNDGSIVKISRYKFETDTIYLSIEDGEAPLPLNRFLSNCQPATEKEYNEYIQDSIKQDKRVLDILDKIL